MDESARVRALLDVLADPRVARAKVTVGDLSLDVEFRTDVDVQPAATATPTAYVVPLAAYVDEHGNPVDLDDGMPELARDPVEAANFPRRQSAE